MSAAELKGGDLVKERRWEGGKAGIYINDITSRQKGFGTSAYRETMRSYFADNLNGKISCAAVGSSHLFHLYMGMVPADEKIKALDLFGWQGRQVMNNFGGVLAFMKEDGDYLQIMKEMIYYVRTGEKNGKKATATITLDDVLNCKRKELSQLEEQKVSYLQHMFIPDLLDILESNDKGKRPTTYALGAVHMAMSQQGIDRWKEDIQNQIGFAPFRQLEPLRAFMNAEQLDRLDRILSSREEKNPKKVKHS